MVFSTMATGSQGYAKKKEFGNAHQPNCRRQIVKRRLIT
jgi:hypothetical protein